MMAVDSVLKSPFLESTRVRPWPSKSTDDKIDSVIGNKRKSIVDIVSIDDGER